MNTYYITQSVLTYLILGNIYVLWCYIVRKDQIISCQKELMKDHDFKHKWTWTLCSILAALAVMVSWPVHVVNELL